MHKDGTLSAAEQALLDVVQAEPGIRTGAAAKRAGVLLNYAAQVVFTLRQAGYIQPSDLTRYGELWPVDVDLTPTNRAIETSVLTCAA